MLSQVKLRAPKNALTPWIIFPWIEKAASEIPLSKAQPSYSNYDSYLFRQRLLPFI